MSSAVASLTAMTEITQILTRLAVSNEDDVQHGWEIQTYSDFTRVRAGTLETFPEADQAMQAALALRQALIDAGLTEMHSCSVGATTEHPGESGWRGTIDLGFRP
jgi:hypothetical protein